MKQPSEVRHFWEEVIRAGPMGLTRVDWSDIKHKLDETSKAVFDRFLESLERQTEWVDAQRKAMRDEAARIALIGETMRRAGLRSYTDEKGRIFVAGRRSVTGSKDHG